MAISKKCKLCSIFVIVEDERELEEAVAKHKESHLHKSNKEATETEREAKEKAKREALLKKYYPNLLNTNNQE
jgi:hypothetical protein